MTYGTNIKLSLGIQSPSQPCQTQSPTPPPLQEPFTFCYRRWASFQFYRLAIHILTSRTLPGMLHLQGMFKFPSSPS